jgi:uncharacterized protein YbaR (Trm112 family)
MAINIKLVDILVCPLCKGKLQYQHEQARLLCRFDRLAYPIVDGIPVLIADKALPLSLDELDQLAK